MSSIELSGVEKKAVTWGHEQSQMSHILLSWTMQERLDQLVYTQRERERIHARERQTDINQPEQLPELLMVFQIWSQPLTELGFNICFWILQIPNSISSGGVKGGLLWHGSHALLIPKSYSCY